MQTRVESDREPIPTGRARRRNSLRALQTLLGLAVALSAVIRRSISRHRTAFTGSRASARVLNARCVAQSTCLLGTSRALCCRVARCPPPRATAVSSGRCSRGEGQAARRLPPGRCCRRPRRQSPYGPATASESADSSSSALHALKIGCRPGDRHPLVRAIPPEPPGPPTLPPARRRAGSAHYHLLIVLTACSVAP